MPPQSLVAFIFFSKKVSWFGTKHCAEYYHAVFIQYIRQSTTFVWGSMLVSTSQGRPGGVVVYQYTRKKKAPKIPENTHNFPKYTQNWKQRSIYVVHCGHSVYISELWRGRVVESAPPPSVFEAQKITGLKPRAGASLCKLSAGSPDRTERSCSSVLAYSCCEFLLVPNTSKSVPS